MAYVKFGSISTSSFSAINSTSAADILQWIEEVILSGEHKIKFNLLSWQLAVKDKAHNNKNF